MSAMLSEQRGVPAATEANSRAMSSAVMKPVCMESATEMRAAPTGACCAMPDVPAVAKTR